MTYLQFLLRGFQALCFLSEKGWHCGSCGSVNAVSFSSAAPGQSTAGDSWIHLPWHPWCPIYIPPKVPINKVSPCQHEINWHFSSFLSTVFAHTLSPTPLSVVKYLNSGFEADVALRQATAQRWDVAQGCAVNAHDGFILPEDLEGSNPLPVLLVAVSQSWANTPGQLCT